MPYNTSRFHLYSNTINLPQEVHCIKHRIENQKLTAYASKRLPEAARTYSITELNLCGLAINIASFSHLLKSGL